MSSKKYEESGFDLNLDTLTIHTKVDMPTSIIDLKWTPITKWYMGWMYI